MGYTQRERALPSIQREGSWTRRNHVSSLPKSPPSAYHRIIASFRIDQCEHPSIRSVIVFISSLVLFCSATVFTILCDIQVFVCTGIVHAWFGRVSPLYCGSLEPAARRESGGSSVNA